jgi:glycosyl transferase family 25
VPLTPGDLAIYVVNLPRRGDRRARMRCLLGPDLLVTYTSDWMGPFDGQSLTAADLRESGHGLFPWEINSENPWWSRPLKTGEIGCTLAHWHCWLDAHSRQAPYALILEDDTVVEAGFLDELLRELERFEEERGELPAPFDLLYLGRYQLEPDTPGPPGFVVPGYSHCTFAYLLTRAAVVHLLHTRLSESIIPVDEFLPAMYIDHPRLDVRTRFARRLQALAFEPALARQLPKDVAGSDTEDSPFVNW